FSDSCAKHAEPIAIKSEKIVSLRTFEKWKKGIWESDLSTARIGGLARAKQFQTTFCKKSIE
ncbi:MAG: hypothetical protein DMG34_10480, partial [Acidobacteria bacterium]